MCSSFVQNFLVLLILLFMIAKVHCGVLEIRTNRTKSGSGKNELVVVDSLGSNKTAGHQGVLVQKSSKKTVKIPDPHKKTGKDGFGGGGHGHGGGGHGGGGHGGGGHGGHGGGGHGGKKKGHKKQQDMMSKIMPMMVMPFMVSTGMIPMMLVSLKFMLLQSAFIGKIAIILMLINMFRGRMRGGGVFSHNINANERDLSMAHYGYGGDEEYGAYVNR